MCCLWTHLQRSLLRDLRKNACDPSAQCAHDGYSRTGLLTKTCSLRLDSFRLTSVDLNEVDLAALHTLSISVRWPHRAEDWQMLLTTGRGIAALDEIGRVVGSAMWFPYSSDFATVGMVICLPRFQAHGAGRWLMEQTLAAVGPRALGLNATRASYRLYSAIGFSDEATVYQYSGSARAPGPGQPRADALLRPARREDLAAIVALDARAFGTERSSLLQCLLAASAGTVLSRGSDIEAFALCRRFGRGFVIGPTVASDDADAIAVTRPHVATHAGTFLRVDTRQRDGAFPAFLAESGLAVYDTVTAMSLRRPWLVCGSGKVKVAPKTYALASQALC